MLSQVFDADSLSKYMDPRLEAEEQVAFYDAQNFVFIDCVDQAARDVERFLSRLEVSSGVPLIVNSGN